jgi:hypothetical protein
LMILLPESDELRSARQESKRHASWAARVEVAGRGWGLWLQGSNLF